MAYSIVMIAATLVAQGAAPAPKAQEKAATRARGGGKGAQGGEAAVAERPICRGGGSLFGSPGRGEEGAGKAHAHAENRSGPGPGRLPVQSGGIWQGDRATQGRRGRGTDERRPPGAAGRSVLDPRRLGGRRGRHARAEKIDPDHLLARWVEARLHDLRGELDKAVVACKWFVDRYNDRRAEIRKDADALLLVGQAAERYYRANARGEQLSDALNDVINEIYETALRVDPNCWRAPWLEGRLFLSGYNERAATRELARAQQINPLSPEVLVTLGQADLQSYRLASGRTKAERALAVNPHFAPAQVLLADLNISDERFVDAHAAARKAVVENPRDEDALARLAASCRLLVDPVGATAAELAALGNNPRPATFYAALGERLADRRKYHSAERAFLLSAAADPTRADAPIGLGMLYMQVGRETEAKSLFDVAFAADPFNVRADNMIKVLRHMATYTPVETKHYSVLVDPTQDQLLGQYMSRYLESIHATLTSRFGYVPPAKTQIEIMKNHQWFSGRTIGLPFVPTVGACTGRVVALASPKATRVPFNWARVLTHEVVHVITLQQTEFNIPHWYTEALAVESEGYPRPQEWNKMLLERVPSRKLLNLDTINLGFIRPKEPEERQLAYCQAQLYARYMLKRFGDDALIKMLMAYRRGLTTDRAIAECFHVEKADFEKGYLAYLDEVLKTIRTRVSEEKPIKFSQLERQLKEKPDDADLNARMAYEHFARKQLLRGAAVRRQGAGAQAASPAGQLRQGAALAVDRRRRCGARGARAGARSETAQRAGDRPPGAAEDGGRRISTRRRSSTSWPEGRPLSHQVDRGPGAGPPPPEEDGQVPGRPGDARGQRRR